MSAVAEQTTTFALAEKSKLIKSLRRFDMVFFTICAFVGLDTLGTVAQNGPEGFLWLVVLAVVFVAPYMLLMSEIGSAFTQEGGPYEWTKLAFGRLHGGIAAILYWVTNPLWVGGSLAFIATDAWRANVFGIGHGSLGDYVFKLLFIWITVLIYGIKHGVAGFGASDLSPTKAVFLGLVPVLLFNYVGFELQNGAAEEMDNPQHDVPVSVLQSGIIGVLLYVIPIFGIILVLPTSQVTGIGGFIDAVTKTFSVYGGAAHTLLVLMTICFVGTLVTSGAVWMIGSDRIQAVAAYDVWIFPAALKLRFTHPEVARPYRVPGRYGMWIGSLVITAWVTLGSFVAVFPGVLEKIFGVGYNFKDNWGVGRGRFELYTLVTLAVILVFGIVGY